MLCNIQDTALVVAKEMAMASAHLVKVSLAKMRNLQPLLLSINSPTSSILIEKNTFLDMMKQYLASFAWFFFFPFHFQLILLPFLPAFCMGGGTFFPF